MDLSQLFDASYIFDSVPPFHNRTMLPLLVFALALIIGGLIISLGIQTGKLKISKIIRKYLRRVPGRLYMFGTLILMYIFFRYENAIYLSSRIVLYVILLSLLVYIVWYAIYVYKKYPIELERLEKKKNKDRYKPGK